uniref:Uncharacterized protein n=1 Tax=viral metagenome TaxID=1070528 RepID=A0A6M3KMH8_9ZZZZ
MNKEESNGEERADKEEVGGKFKEFNNVKNLISELHNPETMSLCNEPSCITCLRDCVWKFNN